MSFILNHKKWLVVVIVVVVILVVSGKDKDNNNQVATTSIDSSWISKESSRPTYIGFTRWPPSFELADIEHMYDFLSEHGDLMAHHFDGGIPWVEALDGAEYSDHLRDDWEFARSRTKSGHKVYVAISPLADDRESLAKYWGETDNMALPAPWKDYALNQGEVKTAFLNYSKATIKFFDPDYLAIGIEVNIAIKNPEVWQAYKELYSYVYKELKAEYPDLQIFATISQAHLEGLEDNMDVVKQKQELQEFLKQNDVVGVSSYPYGFGGRTIKSFPETYFDSIIDLANGKPIAITETGMPSQNFKSHLFSYNFSEADQLNYINFLLRKSSEHKFEFIVNWVAVDFDKLVKDIPSLFARSLAMLWAYTGLERSDGVAKPALAVWDAYLALPNK